MSSRSHYGALSSSFFGSEAISRIAQHSYIDNPGLFDLAVEEYSNRHLLQVSAESFLNHRKPI